MPSFSKTSLDRLDGCHADLRNLMLEVIKHIDITVLEGHRSVSTGRTERGSLPVRSSSRESPARWASSYALALIGTGISESQKVSSTPHILNW